MKHMRPGPYKKTIYDDMHPSSESQGKGTEFNDGRVEKIFKNAHENPLSNDSPPPPPPPPPPPHDIKKTIDKVKNDVEKILDDKDGKDGELKNSSIQNTLKNVSDSVNNILSTGGNNMSSQSQQSLQNQLTNCQNICSSINDWKNNNIKTTTAIDQAITRFTQKGGIHEALNLFSQHNISYQREIKECLNLLDRQQKAFVSVAKGIKSSMDQINKKPSSSSN